ncbi:hypothetical protein [Flexibacterium corallicola]|uniref:hypothetical protein n=1 Tax=Flexibacterium corallicola TaxID=3037259 RepID=UPI00286F035A|nr:hypothetical protein [Pseudovibrio sp. M1P-2-3]
MYANKSRGEVLITVRGHSVIVVAGMEGMAKLETALNGQALLPMLSDVMNMKVSTLKAAVECMAVAGNPESVYPQGFLDFDALKEIKAGILAAVDLAGKLSREQATEVEPGK